MEKEKCVMLVFSTRIPLKKTVTQKDCLLIINEWIEKSPHYSIKIDVDKVLEDNDIDIDFAMDNITVSFKKYEDDKINVFACRLVNEETDSIWYNDCIFVSESENKYLFVELYYSSKCYKAMVPKINKPHIIKKLFESGLCGNDGDISVVDTPIMVDDKSYEVCKDIMNGRSDCSMPAVYISCNACGGTDVDSTLLAKKLGGIAHVFVEKDRVTSLKLQSDTNRNNVYIGYIGVYFPHSTFCKKYSLGYYDNKSNKMIEEINSYVRSALVNRLDATQYNWNQLSTLQSKQKMLTWKGLSAKHKEELNSYISNFDHENEEKDEKIKNLNAENNKLHARIDSLEESLHSSNGKNFFYRLGAEKQLYDSEINDLLFGILSSAKSQYVKESRGYVLIDSLLEANPQIGECAQIMKCVKEVFGNGNDRPLSGMNKNKLKKAGFTFKDENGHCKMSFYNDDRYTFTVSKTPSDYRSGKNMFTDIRNKIDVTRKTK